MRPERLVIPASTPAALVTVTNPPCTTTVPLFTSPPPVDVPSVRVAAPPKLLFAPKTPTLVAPTVAIRLLNPGIGAWATNEAAPTLMIGNCATLPTPAITLLLVIVPEAPLRRIVPPEMEIVPLLTKNAPCPGVRRLSTAFVPIVPTVAPEPLMEDVPLTVNVPALAPLVIAKMK